MCHSWKDKIDAYLTISHGKHEAKEKSVRRREILNSSPKTSKTYIGRVRLHDEAGESVR